MHLPEFGKALQITGMAAYIFDVLCKYDMIIRCNWMILNKFDLSFSTQTMKWFK